MITAKYKITEKEFLKYKEIIAKLDPKPGLRILNSDSDYIVPDVVHIMIKGKVVRSGGKELIAKIDAEGYDWLKAELGMTELSEVATRPAAIGTCATKVSK